MQAKAAVLYEVGTPFGSKRSKYCPPNAVKSWSACTQVGCVIPIFM
jgi:hypothetical protein